MPQCNEVYIHVAFELESSFLTQKQQFDRDTLKVYFQPISKVSWADGNGSLSEFFFSHAINKQSFKEEITMLYLFSRSEVSNMNHPLSVHRLLVRDFDLYPVNAAGFCRWFSGRVPGQEVVPLLTHLHPIYCVL